VSIILLLESFSLANVTCTRFLLMDRHCSDLWVQNTTSMMSMVWTALHCWRDVVPCNNLLSANLLLLFAIVAK